MAKSKFKKYLKQKPTMRGFRKKSFVETDSKGRRTIVKKQSDRKAIKGRERKTRGLLTAVGVIQGKQSYKGPGRPRGTFKYGVPIQVYKKNLRDRKYLYQKYQQEQVARLRPKGFSEEQIRELQQRQTMEELEQPTAQRVQQRVQQLQQGLNTRQIQNQRMRVPTGKTYVTPGRSIADDELSFRKWSAESSITPNTQRMLDTIRRIQNKGKTDNIDQQRRLRERLMVGRSMNLMKAHENMIDVRLDMTGVDPEQNILMAPSVFKEDGSNNILRNNRGALGILNTREAGNDLQF